MAYRIAFPPEATFQETLGGLSLPRNSGDFGDGRPIALGFSSQSSPLKDQYSCILDDAMRVVARPDSPEGMIPWLANSCPLLYIELTDGLPNQMQELWKERAPLQEFKTIVKFWVEAHEAACEMYLKHLADEKRRGRR